ncbi:MAG: Fic family protein [Sphingomonas sp.]|jgi:Fic family protein|uniref:Fic family protein n=1 Tax=Sphingomonadaceae TaxID=41297 RepID=UPI0006C8A462|nr:Fic family protein [Novosphingobium sp. ST904]KPH60576.1 cell filamentation protein Fic [Novosphingobium sp. ST904]MBY0304088.1 Fic family protein [Sphingomonas sp.]TCM39434.1 Fic family protein [Novosphingobium sp. ST904]
MSEFSPATCPEVFVSHTAISDAVYAAVGRGELRKIGSRLYTRNLTEDPERLVRRNWYHLITSYYPDALITDRTALENKPAADGSVFLISEKGSETALPGLTLRPRKGAAAIDSDKPFAGGALLASTPRAYLENMRTSRARGGRVPRTLTREELEQRLDALLRTQGEGALNKLRDDARAIAPSLGLETEFDELNDLIGAYLGTREAKTESAVGRARAAGQPFDPDRIVLFENLFGALREAIPAPRIASAQTGTAIANLAFFEAYFSNFIEGTEFSVGEAREIVFEGAIPAERPEDAHDVLGTFRIVSDMQDMSILPANAEELDALLRRRHATLMQARPDKHPGSYKTKVNQAGSTVFVAPELVNGTLERGFEFYRALEEPFQRAVFMMMLVSEVHPFADGNGRTARIMMNAELVAGGQERIIIPTAYRTDYLGALKAFSKNGQTAPLIRMLDVAQSYTGMIDWSDFERARTMLDETNAFAEGADAKLRIPAGALS